MTKRGQTANDYLVGIILLLLTIAVVFGYFPSMFEPFDDPVGSEEKTMADSLGAELISNASVSGTEQTINVTRAAVLLNQSSDDFRNESGIPDWRRWNVTLVNASGQTVDVAATGTKAQGGDEWDGTPSATTIRFVQAQNETNAPKCAHGCRIIIRVW